MNRRSAFAFSVRAPTLLLCSLLAAQSGQAATGTPAPPPAPAPPPSTSSVPPSRGTPPGVPRSDYADGERHGNDWVPWAIGLGALAITATAVAANAKKNGTAVDDQGLLQNGPRFPDSYGVGVFAVQGYAGDGWPVVVDFLSRPGTCTTLEISVGDQLVSSKPLDWEGRGGRQFAQIDLPKGTERRGAATRNRNPAKVAMYVIHSRTPACGQPGPRTPAPVEVYGIGAGPRAVGSVAIENLSFGPARPRFPNEQVAMGYEAKTPFNHAAVEILRYDVTPDATNVQRVRSTRTDAVQVGANSGGAWDGMSDRGARSTGVHRLQVRGWFTENDRSWVGAISPTSVQVAP